MNAVKTFKKQEIPSTFQDSLRFKDICPVWASKFRTGFDEQDVKTLVHDSKYCIVGEAWGYTGRHAGYYVAPLIPFVGCWTCVKLGREMGRIAKEFGLLQIIFDQRFTFLFITGTWSIQRNPRNQDS